MRILLLSLSLLSSLSYGMTVNSDILRKSAALTNAKLIYDKEHFIVDENGKQQAVQRYNMSKDLRSLSEDQVKTLLSNKNALLYLRKLSDKSYALELEGKLNGGLPATGWLAYQITRGLLYGTTAVIATTAVTAGVITVVGSGGAATPVVAAVAGKAVGVGIGMSASTLAAPIVASAGGSIIGAGVATGLTAAVGTETVALGTGAVLTAAGGGWGYIAMVEGISATVGGFFAVQPWCP